MVSASTGSSVVVALDRHDRARGSQSATVSVPIPGPDLEHGLVAGEGGELEDPPDDVVVDQEVLAERLLGVEAVALRTASVAEGVASGEWAIASRG